MSRDNIWSLVIPVVVVLVLLALAALLLRRRNRRRTAERREQASTLRERAAARATDVRRSADAVLVAEDHAAQARARAEEAEDKAVAARQAAQTERTRQEELVREADRLDPAVNHRARGYEPQVPGAPSSTAAQTRVPDPLTDPLQPEDDSDRTPPTPTEPPTPSASAQKGWSMSTLRIAQARSAPADPTAVDTAAVDTPTSS